VWKGAGSEQSLNWNERTSDWAGRNIIPDAGTGDRPAPAEIGEF
jgi:hypothetical protein